MISVFGTGRLVRDPELTPVENKTKTTVVCNFSLAVDEYIKVDGQKEKLTSFFDFEAWDTGGQALADNSKKGDLIIFKASARQNKWVNSEGKNRSKVVFRLEEFQIVKKHDDSPKE